MITQEYHNTLVANTQERLAHIDTEIKSIPNTPENYEEIASWEQLRLDLSSALNRLNVAFYTQNQAEYSAVEAEITSLVSMDVLTIRTTETPELNSFLDTNDPDEDIYGDEFHVAQITVEKGTYSIKKIENVRIKDIAQDRATRSNISSASELATFDMEYLEVNTIVHYVDSSYNLNAFILKSNANGEHTVDGISVIQSPTPLRVWVKVNVGGNQTYVREGISTRFNEPVDVKSVEEALDFILFKDRPPLAKWVTANASLEKGTVLTGVDLEAYGKKVDKPLRLLQIKEGNEVLESISFDPASDVREDIDTLYGTISSNKTFSVIAQDGAGLQASASLSFNFYDRMFYGQLPANLLTENDQVINAQIRTLGSKLTNSVNSIPEFTGQMNSSYWYWAFPKSHVFSSMTVFVNGLVNNAFLSKDFKYIADNGLETEYTLVRSDNLLNGPFQIKIQK